MEKAIRFDVFSLQSYQYILIEYHKLIDNKSTFLKQRRYFFQF